MKANEFLLEAEAVLEPVEGLVEETTLALDKFGAEIAAVRELLGQADALVLSSGKMLEEVTKTLEWAIAKIHQAQWSNDRGNTFRMLQTTRLALRVQLERLMRRADR